MAEENLVICGCDQCICRRCMLWWSSRCPYGECYDDHRAKVNPYDKAHPGESPRTGWTNWKTDQAFWCRGGVTYPVSECPDFVQYQKPQVKECLKSNIQVWADGYVQCSLIDCLGCEACYNEFLVGRNDKEEDDL